MTAGNPDIAACYRLRSQARFAILVAAILSTTSVARADAGLIEARRALSHSVACV
jgi:hypothetical protein